MVSVWVLLNRGHAYLQVWQQRGDGAQRRLPYRLDAVLRQAVQLSQQYMRVRGELQQARQAAQQVRGQGATLRRWAADLCTTGYAMLFKVSNQCTTPLGCTGSAVQRFTWSYRVRTQCTALLGCTGSTPSARHPAVGAAGTQRCHCHGRTCLTHSGSSSTATHAAPKWRPSLSRDCTRARRWDSSGLGTRFSTSATCTGHRDTWDVKVPRRRPAPV